MAEASPQAQRVQALLDTCAAERVEFNYPSLVIEAYNRYLRHLAAQGIIDTEAAMEQILEEQATLIQAVLDQTAREAPAKPKLAIVKNRKW